MDSHVASQDTVSPELVRANLLEREAQKLLEEKNINPAFRKFDEAAGLYRKNSEHVKASLCYASAATCWNIHTGWQPFRNAASRSELAAEEAAKSKNYHYACRLFREASFFYEKEGDYEKFSHCAVSAQDAKEKDLFQMWVQGEKRESLAAFTHSVPWKDRLRCLIRWLLSVFNRFLWGYGERPLRTLSIAFFVIVISAAFYGFSNMVSVDGVVRDIDFWEAVYFSVVTFATVGYGDFIPTGWIRIVAMVQSVSGILLTPLFLISLTRRYLRMQG